MSEEKFNGVVPLLYPDLKTEDEKEALLHPTEDKKDDFNITFSRKDKKITTTFSSGVNWKIVYDFIMKNFNLPSWVSVDEILLFEMPHVEKEEYNENENYLCLGNVKEFTGCTSNCYYEIVIFKGLISSIMCKKLPDSSGDDLNDFRARRIASLEEKKKKELLEKNYCYPVMIYFSSSKNRVIGGVGNSLEAANEIRKVLAEKNSDFHGAIYILKMQFNQADVSSFEEKDAVDAVQF
jgi:hypothetical protein